MIIKDKSLWKKKKTREELLLENAALKGELNDMKLRMEAVTGHSDGIESDLPEKSQAGENLFQIMIRTIPVPFLIVGKGGDILFSNEHANRLFGYSAESFLNCKAGDLYKHPEDCRNFLKIMSEQGRVDNFQVQAKKQDGSSCPVSLYSQPITFRGQNCILTIIYDLTERIKAEAEKMALEKQIRQTQRIEAIGTLSGGIAHDFNNILAIILGNMELAGMMLPAESRVHVYHGNIVYAANRAKEMVSRILDFCRQREQDRMPFRIGKIISEAVKMIKGLTPSNIEVKLRLEAGNPIIDCDPTQILQVLMNLCSNAAYVMREKGGTIEIILVGQDRIVAPIQSSPDPYVRLTVSDDGPGMDKDIVDRIFDPFFTTKPLGEGTGLGLSIVHGIVQNHGGTMTVESGQGKGSAFHCYFPLLPETDGIPENGEAKKKMPGGRESILWVDDEQGILEIFAEMLEPLGYEIVTCPDSVEALSLFRNSGDRFDIVITDYIMPKMTGKSLARKMTGICPDIPIIITTGFGDLVDRNDLMEIGIRGLIAKPFSLEQIAGLIRKIMDERR